MARTTAHWVIWPEPTPQEQATEPQARSIRREVRKPWKRRPSARCLPTKTRPLISERSDPTSRITDVTPVAKPLSLQLASIVRPFPPLAFGWADEALFRRFRSLDPTLVSCLDSHSGDRSTEEEYLVVTCNEVPTGLVSLVTRENRRRPPASSLYTRIDLVIVEKRFRRLGLARLIVLASIVHAVKVRGSRLYSISCLAADPAIERILLPIGFASSQRNNRTFVHQELKLGHVSRDTLVDRLMTDATAAARIATYRLRNRKPEDAIPA